MPRLENWSLASIPTSPFLAPEFARSVLCGKVYDHPRFADGHEIVTSTVAGFEEGMVRTVSGSLYELGSVNPDYESAYPNARERLLAQAQPT